MSMRRRTDRAYAWGTMHHGAQIHAPERATGDLWQWTAWQGAERVSGHAGDPVDAVVAVEHFAGELAGRYPRARA